MPTKHGVARSNRAGRAKQSQPYLRIYNFLELAAIACKAYRPSKPNRSMLAF